MRPTAPSLDPSSRAETAPDESAILTLLDDARRAVAAKDGARVLAHYDPDLTTFDLVEPLMNRGVDAVRRRLHDWFASFEGAIEYEHRDVELNIGDGVAFGRCFTHVRGTHVSGALIDMWFRET